MFSSLMIDHLIEFIQQSIFFLIKHVTVGHYDMHEGLGNLFNSFMVENINQI